MIKEHIQREIRTERMKMLDSIVKKAEIGLTPERNITPEEELGWRIADRIVKARQLADEIPRTASIALKNAVDRMIRKVDSLDSTFYASNIKDPNTRRSLVWLFATVDDCIAEVRAIEN